MIGMNVQQATGGFFDRQKVIEAVGRAEAKVMARGGAFVRTRARSSIRKRRRASAPGSPPSSHTGLLKRLIFFAWDNARRTTVIGPALTNQAAKAARAVGDTVPGVLERGGAVEIEERQFQGRGRPVRRKRRTVKIAARPYMVPALEAESPKIADLWRDAVK